MEWTKFQLRDRPLEQVTPQLLESGAGLPRAPPMEGTAIYLPFRKAWGFGEVDGPILTRRSDYIGGA